MHIPPHLTQPTATGEKVGEPIAQFEIGNYQNFVYLILDWQNKEAAWIDPQKDLSRPLECLKQYGFQLKWILLTHTHFDHIAGLSELAELFPQASIGVNDGDLPRLKPFIQKKVQNIRDGDLLSVGNLSIEVLHTPGHSPGECCYWVKSSPPYLLTGDTVFIRDCGRTDLEGGSNIEMFNSLQKLKRLPPEAIILPGHHYQPECASTLQKEMKESPPFQCNSVEELASLP
jgi:glyoxylase-like metal-dependent hydrolase (beta-lactamase superfamily II)